MMFQISVVIFSCLTPFSGVFGYFYETLYYDQKIDHFSYTNKDTYEERYLVNNDSWVKGGPIFFYAGNEGDILSFANNTGLMWYWAHDFGAMIVFAEHRFYGVSLPYGSTFNETPSHFGYLTSEQALADYAELLTYMKETIDGAENSPVIVFGGSYGGMLAAWFRMKYPHIVDGALASSAPLGSFTGMIPCNSFSQIATDVFGQASKECVEVIRKSWGVMANMSETESGRKFLTDTFHLCEPLNVNNTQYFLGYFTETWSNVAMTNYPYPTNFMMPLPGNPVKATCERMTNASADDYNLMQQVYLGVSVFQNYSGSTICYDTSNPDGPDLSVEQWDFQCCTELVIPSCSDNVNDMFSVSPWDFHNYTTECQQWFNVTPEAYKDVVAFGGRDISSLSNIIFSNGLLDPWHGGGILQSLSNSLVAIVIPDAAHHLDLRYPDSADPISVVNARQQEKSLIAEWIQAAGKAKGGGATLRSHFLGSSVLVLFLLTTRGLFL